jgi:hypothetical protein
MDLQLIIFRNFICGWHFEFRYELRNCVGFDFPLSYCALNSKNARYVSRLYLDRFVGAEEMTGSYAELYEACLVNNVAKIDALCAPEREEAQCLVAVRSGILKVTPIDVAVEMGHVEAVIALIKHAHRQYTPLPPFSRLASQGGSNWEQKYFDREGKRWYSLNKDGMPLLYGGDSNKVEAHVSTSGLLMSGNAGGGFGTAGGGLFGGVGGGPTGLDNTSAVVLTEKKGARMQERMDEYRQDAQVEDEMQQKLMEMNFRAEQLMDDAGEAGASGGGILLLTAKFKRKILILGLNGMTIFRNLYDGDYSVLTA